MENDNISSGVHEQNVFLGEYELIRRLAVGGMAEIFLARKRGMHGFEKKVVLKRILPHYAMNSVFVSMFLDEARLAARLQHANVAQVYDIGCEEGQYFFTMEHVHGEDVRNMVRYASRYKEPIDFDLVLTIVRDVAAGLHNAHEECDSSGKPLGIVHRDISLSNVIVSFDGCVKIVDFGVAKAAQHKSETKVGTLKGKVGYMSPEQVRGKDIDRRSDIFSLGIVMYELLCAKRLYATKSPVTTAHKIASDPPPCCLEYRPNTHEALIQVLQKALAKKPEDRYQTAKAFQKALERAATEAGLTLSNAGLGDHMQDIFSEKLTLTRLMDKDSFKERSLNHSLVAEDSTADESKNMENAIKGKRLALGTDCPALMLERDVEKTSEPDKDYNIKPNTNLIKVLSLFSFMALLLVGLWNYAGYDKNMKDHAMNVDNKKNDSKSSSQDSTPSVIPVVSTPVKIESSEPVPVDKVTSPRTVDTKRKNRSSRRNRSVSRVKSAIKKTIKIEPPSIEQEKWDSDSALPPM